MPSHSIHSVPPQKESLWAPVFIFTWEILVFSSKHLLCFCLDHSEISAKRFLFIIHHPTCLWLWWLSPMKTKLLPSVFKILISPILFLNDSCILLHHSTASSLSTIPFSNLFILSSHVSCTWKPGFTKVDPKIGFLLAHFKQTEEPEAPVCLQYRSNIARKQMLLY